MKASNADPHENTASTIGDANGRFATDRRGEHVVRDLRGG